MRQPDGTSHGDIDIFNPDVWRIFSWPKKFFAADKKNAFVEKTLPQLLGSAKEFVCEIAGYDLDAKFEVVRFYGNAQKTICKIIIDQPAAEGLAPKIEEEKCPGDGTVPTWIAAEEIRKLDANKTRSAVKTHSDLAASIEFMEYLRQYKNELKNAMVTEYKKLAENVDGLAILYAKLGVLVPIAPSLETSVAAKELQRQIVANFSLSADDLYSAAKDQANPTYRSQVYRLFADIADPENPKRPWALTNAAHIELKNRDYVTAEELASQALETAEITPWDPRDLRAKAGLTAAIAAKELGRARSAETYRAIAIENGSAKALRLW